VFKKQAIERAGKKNSPINFFIFDQIKILL